MRFTLNPRGWLSQVLIAGGAQQAPQYNSEVHPTTKVVTNQGQINHLHNQISGRDETIAERDETIARLNRTAATMRRIATRVIPRISKLAANIGSILRATNVTNGTPTSDETGMAYKLSNDAGEWLTLVLYPFNETFTLSDPSNNMQPRTFRLGLTPTAELDEMTILVLNGFAEFVARRAADQTSAFWTTTFNRTLSPVRTPVPAGAPSTDNTDDDGTDPTD
jgi:hypothetical protein